MKINRRMRAFSWGRDSLKLLFPIAAAWIENS
jgi:hypothetical protein